MKKIIIFLYSFVFFLTINRNVLAADFMIISQEIINRLKNQSTQPTNYNTYNPNIINKTINIKNNTWWGFGSIKYQCPNNADKIYPLSNGRLAPNSSIGSAWNIPNCTYTIQTTTITTIGNIVIVADDGRNKPTWYFENIDWKNNNGNPANLGGLSWTTNLAINPDYSNNTFYLTLSDNNGNVIATNRMRKDFPQ